MAGSKNKAGKNYATNKSSNKSSGNSSTDTKKIPSFTSVSSDNRERRDGPGGN